MLTCLHKEMWSCEQGLAEMVEGSRLILKMIVIPFDFVVWDGLVKLVLCWGQASSTATENMAPQKNIYG